MSGRRPAARQGAVAIVVLAKHPARGRVKTRLAATIGAPAATALYAAFVRDLARRLRGTGYPVWWAFTPRAAPFSRLVGTRRCFPQCGGDLGARIDHAIRNVARRTGRAVIALGADAPHVSRREIARADRALGRGIDVVLGPAADGGYYLIGVRAPRPRLFTGIAWGTSGVAAATRRRCRALGLAFIDVASDFDVDGIDDLRALVRVVRRRPHEFPRTHAVLRRLTRRVGWLRPAASPSSDCGRR